MKYLVAYSTIDSGVSLRSHDASSALAAVKKDYQQPKGMDRRWWDDFCDTAERYPVTLFDRTAKPNRRATTFWHRDNPERWCCAIAIDPNERLTVFCSGVFNGEERTWEVVVLLIPRLELYGVAHIRDGEVTTYSEEPRKN